MTDCLLSKLALEILKFNNSIGNVGDILQEFEAKH